MLTADRDYGVRVIRAYEHRRVGQIFFPPGILRQRLIQAGFVEAVAPDKKTEPASPPPPSDTRRKKI